MRYLITLIILFLITAQHLASQELDYPLMKLKRQVAISDDKTQYTSPVIYLGDVDQRSVGKAFFLSLALPGMGEFYNGQKSHGRFFFGTELMLWAGLFANNKYVDLLKEEYYSYATHHGNISRDGKDKTFWVNIGKYDNLFEFNEQRRRDRFVDAIYPENEDYSWDWDSRENRFNYDKKRITANEVANRDTYFYAAIVLNHLVSGINAMRLVRKHNKKAMVLKNNWDLRFFAHKENDYQHRFGFRFITTF